MEDYNFKTMDGYSRDETRRAGRDVRRETRGKADGT